MIWDRKEGSDISIPWLSLPFAYVKGAYPVSARNGYSLLLILLADMDFSRHTWPALVPGPGHNCPLFRGKLSCIFVCVIFFSAPCHFIKHGADDSRGLADWNLRLNSFLSNPSWFTASVRVSCDFTRCIYLILVKAWLPSKYNFPLTQSPPPGRLSKE